MTGEYSFSFHQQVCEMLDNLALENGYYRNDAALEGLNSNVVGRLFVSIVDSFGQLLKTFGTNFSRITKSLKRSELNEFVMSNTLKTKVVDKLPYEKCMEVDVDVPANMKGTYKAAVDSLVKVYTSLNALNNGRLVDVSFREALNAINTRDPKLSKQVEATATIVGRLVNAAHPAIDLCMSKFEDKFNYKKAFETVFLTSQEWVDVRKTLIENEYRLQDVKPIADVVDSLEGTLRQIASAAEANDTKITPRDLKNMSETAKGIALVFDAYGMATTRQMALEHNYILCLNHLYSTVK